jgi:hypothetical protein
LEARNPNSKLNLAVFSVASLHNLRVSSEGISKLSHQVYLEPLKVDSLLAYSEASHKAIPHLDFLDSQLKGDYSDSLSSSSSNSNSSSNHNVLK